MLFSLSVALDTIDHSILLRHRLDLEVMAWYCGGCTPFCLTQVPEGGCQAPVSEASYFPMGPPPSLMVHPLFPWVEAVAERPNLGL